MTETFVCTFDDPAGLEKSAVGGKGANLVALTQAGFDVPPGFCVTTDAYTSYLTGGTIGAQVKEIVSALDYSAEALERSTASIRQLITAGEVPAEIRAQIEAAYQKLGQDVYVAVRSSGTAEDLAEASFAGLHDTYLDIQGTDDVVDAVKRCWASMWTSRATAYRHNNNFNHNEASLSVVVQTMVASEVSGVMFTGNPMTTATDEVLINASYGLGEAVVSGITNPDTFVVKTTTMVIKEKILGEKEVQIRRGPTGSGTVEIETPRADSIEFCLDDAQIEELTRLGLRVQDHYDGFPQDIEWALQDGAFYPLQSRPVTGVEFSWDADVEDCHQLADDPDTIWTRALADEVTTGVVTPMHYSIRYGGIYSNIDWPNIDIAMGLPETARKRTFKYRKAEVYFNAGVERDWIERATPPVLRAGRVYWLPETWRDEVVNAKFNWTDYVKTLVRLQTLDSRFKWNGMFWHLDNWRDNRDADSRGLYAEQLRKLSDREVVRYIERQVAFESEWNNAATCGFLYWYPEALNLLAAIVGHWYDGDNASAYVELVSGADEKTDTQLENEKLSGFTETIRNSPTLTKLFEENEDGAFFAALDDHEEGRAFLKSYRDFMWESGHRGHADRDLWYIRREEDPSVDYRTFKLMLGAPSIDHEALRRTTNDRRAATFEAVLENIRRTPFGAIKAEIFKLSYAIAHRFIIARDNERCRPGDAINMSQKRGLREIGRRMVERGDLNEEMDVLYLTRQELYPWFEGNSGRVRLLKAKIEARKRDVLRFDRKEVEHPLYLHGDQVVDLSHETEAIEGVLQGHGTSPGTTVGTARVVRSLAGIGAVNHGEILVVHSTDPGWTPVFLIIKGVVVETGGILAHASCLAREYGFPAVQLPKALALIPDGATIEIDGATGRVRVLDETPATSVPEPA